MASRKVCIGFQVMLWQEIAADFRSRRTVNHVREEIDQIIKLTALTGTLQHDQRDLYHHFGRVYIPGNMPIVD